MLAGNLLSPRGQEPLYHEEDEAATPVPDEGTGRQKSEVAGRTGSAEAVAQEEVREPAAP